MEKESTFDAATECAETDQGELAELAIRFTYHPPRGDQPDRYVAIRNGAFDLARLIVGLCPKSREQSLALTAIENAVFWANAGIARRTPGED